MAITKRSDGMDVDSIQNMYTSNEYIKKNPSLHEEDSPWKVSKIIPIVDKMFTEHIPYTKEINLLDVGGGAGIIMRDISNYIEKHYDIHVNKYAIDLSPGMLEIQKKNNPSLKTFNEDICETSLANKEIDITLMIDVLEHVSDPKRALEELQRISNVVIFKVPLELTAISYTLNIVKRGKPRKHAIETIGHINVYSTDSLKRQIEEYCGEISYVCFTNVFDYYINSEHYKQKLSNKSKIINRIGSNIFKVSPTLCSYLISDFAMILTKCK